MRSIFLTLAGLNLVLLVAQLLWLRPDASEATVLKAEPLVGPPLWLLGEPGASAEIRPRDVPLEVPVSEVASATGHCVLVGAFAVRGQAEDFVEYLQALEVRAGVRELEVPDGANYWVYLPPEISKQDALRRLYELQAKQIDSYIIPRGDLQNGISLGMFSRKGLAEQQRNDLRNMGYPAEILELERSLREIWVIMPLREAEKLAANLWQELLSRQSGLEKRQNLCPSVASE